MKKRVVSFSFFIALVLLSSTFMVYQNTVVIGDSQGVSVIQEDLVERFRPSYEDHAPISITGDENLTKMAEQNAWDGEGTLEEPYIIEGYNISLSGTPGTCITLYDISLYVVLRDCFIGNATWGIYLVNVTRFSSIGNIIYGNGFGMYTLLCDNSIIMDTIFEEDYYGIYVEKAMNVHIEGCQFIKSWAAIDACDLASSWIVDNTITDVEYGIVLEPSCIDNEVRQNSISEASSIGIILSLASEYNKIVLNCLNSDSWGAYDDSAGTTNVFSHNYYSDYTSIDVDEDGVYDIPYLIPGVSGVYDYHPLRYEPLPPSWAYAPVDFEMELGSSCFRQLQVNSYPPIAHWVVNDTLHFEIDHNGVLLDRGNLVLGDYGLEVNVTDLYGQSVTGVFKVTVVDSAYPVFVTTLEDVSFYYGEEVAIQVIAWDNAWVEEWTLSDTGNFTISWESYGEMSVATIESVGSLEVGSYPIHITVFDSSGLMVATSFTVTIERLPDQGAPLILVVASSGVAGLAIVLGLLSLLRTRKV